MEIHNKKPWMLHQFCARFIPYHNLWYISVIKKYHKAPISLRHTLSKKQNRRGLQTGGLQTGRCTKCEDQEIFHLTNLPYY